MIDLARLLDEYGIPSATIGVLRDGEITELSVGVTDVETGARATPDTIYQLGSMTKTWTALAFLHMVDEGTVALDEPVKTYLPEFTVADPETSANVTPRHLLNHTNGIEESFGDPGEDDDVYERMVANIADAGQVHPLGHTHGYSAALGYAILARIMEVTDGRRWDDIMRDRLFEPLGLTSTSTRPDQVDRDRAARGHIVLAQGPIPTPIDYLPRAYGPGGNMNSTAREVLTMAKSLLGTENEMTTSRVSIPDPYMFGPEWALGLIVCDWRGETVYATDGSTIGQNARLRILPARNAAITMLTNGGPRESFYKRVFNDILSEMDAPTIPDLPKPDPTLALDPSRYVGVYERPGTHYEVESVAGKLYLTVAVHPMEAEFLGKPDHIRYELLPISDTHFLLPPTTPREDPQTAAIYDFQNGKAQYLHTNCRVTPRA